MKAKSHAFCFAALIVVALIPLNAEESGPKPDPSGTEQQPAPRVQPPPPVPCPGASPIPIPMYKQLKRERRTLVVAELRDIRFNVTGPITFRHPSTEDIYEWTGPSGENRVVVLAAVLTELRRAEKVDLVVYSQPREGGGNVDHRFIIDKMTLVYDSLK